jgi:polysaccharide pyruvyl transferase WcaK-like protein
MQGSSNVAVFGAYSNGNFGDDLMGHLIASSLAGAGYTPRLWRGPNNAFRGKTWTTYSDMERFVSGSACVVFGGGMVFGDSRFSAYWADISKLVDVCEALRVPIVAISVSSNGVYDNLNAAAKKLLASPMFKAATPRLMCDADWLKKQGMHVAYIPDIVLTAMAYKPKVEMKRVMIAVHSRPWERPLLDWVVSKLLSRGIEVLTIGPLQDGTSNVDSYYHRLGTKVRNDGPSSVLDAVRDVDVLIGSGLHIGMAALAGGAEFISYRGEGKTHHFMEECGRRRLVIKATRKLEKLFCFYRLHRLLLGPVDGGGHDTLQDMMAQAHQHYRFMLDQIEQVDLSSNGKPPERG